MAGLGLRALKSRSLKHSSLINGYLHLGGQNIVLDAQSISPWMCWIHIDKLPSFLFSWLSISCLLLRSVFGCGRTFISALVSQDLYWQKVQFKRISAVVCSHPFLHWWCFSSLLISEHAFCSPPVPPTSYCLTLPTVYFGSHKRNSLQDLHSGSMSYLQA